MPRTFRALAALALCALAPLASAQVPPAPPLAPAETMFLDYLDALGAVGYIESGGTQAVAGQGLAAWRAQLDARQATLRADLEGADRDARLDAADRSALAAMRKTLADLAADTSTSGARNYACADAQRRDLDGAALRAALVSCFIEFGNRMSYAGRTIDRGTALQRLHVEEDPRQRRALFDAFQPLWQALNGSNAADSPYRRMIALAAADARAQGSPIDAAARAVGVSTTEVERWLVQILEAWRDSNPATPVEPWDYRYVNSRANRELQSRIPASALLAVNERFYADLGVSLPQLQVVFDLAQRPDKSSVAYTDFLTRGRVAGGRWQRPVPRVLGTYPEGGLFSLNELVHESGHAVHVAAIRTRPAYMDWPDTLFVEAFADVPSWSVYEPAWQQRYLGASVPEAVSIRALFGDVMLDVAWSLFELRLLRDPAQDPNALWTQITHEYLRIVPHPEVPWWAMRVQLAGNPGYMVNYGLGAVLTAEMRAAAKKAIGDFDTGNARWYEWLSPRLLQYGSERSTPLLMQGLLGRRVTPDALLQQVRRCGGRAR